MRMQLGIRLLCLIVVGGSGCGHTNKNPPTFPVTGILTFKGNPVEGADIVFVPSSPGALAAIGKTDAEGKFAMRTFEPGDGVVTGSYKVKVWKLEVSGVDDKLVFASPEKEAEVYEGPKSVRPAKNLLPLKFADHDSSGLTHSVVSEPTVFDIKL